MKLSAKTDVGLVRDLNEDSVRFGLMRDRINAYGIVCDGMGGANAGEVASAMACDILTDEILNGFSADMSESEILDLLYDAMERASGTIYDRSRSDRSLRGMGTTAVCSIITHDYVYIAHAGDSRAYMFNEGRIKQLTRDHSYVQQLVDSNMLTPEEAKIHPKRNYLTKALGTAPTLECDTFAVPFAAGNILMICSDGLTGYPEDPVIADTIALTPFNQIPSALIEKAKHGGGGDNITVFIASRNDEEGGREAWPAPDIMEVI